jgi:hypothetical protein
MEETTGPKGEPSGQTAPVYAHGQTNPWCARLSPTQRDGQPGLAAPALCALCTLLDWTD